MRKFLKALLEGACAVVALASLPQLPPFSWEAHAAAMVAVLCTVAATRALSEKE